MITFRSYRNNTPSTSADHAVAGLMTRKHISNRRLVSFDEQSVVFYTRNGKTASLAPLK